MESIARDEIDELQLPVSTAEWLSRLPLPVLTEIEVDVTYVRHVRLRSPASAVVRGLLGERLRARHCLTGAAKCEGCEVWQRCDYAGVFATGIGSRLAPGGLADLHPYWLQGFPAERELQPGTRINARLVTAGIGEDLLQSLHLAFRDAVGCLGEAGKTDVRRAPLLSASRALSRRPVVEPHDADTWWIETRTPVLLTAGRGDAYLPRCRQAPWLPLLLSAGARRLRALSEMFSPDSTPTGHGDRLCWPSLDDLEILSGEARPWDGAVVSHRQGRAFPLDCGVTCKILVRAGALRQIGPLLRLLEHTGVGKKTTMGFGHLRVEPVRPARR